MEHIDFIVIELLSGVKGVVWHFGEYTIVVES